MLGKHSQSVLSYSYPPGKLTDPMFLPRDQNGLGMQRHRFAWEQYEDVPQKNADPPKAPPTDIGHCQTPNR